MRRSLALVSAGITAFSIVLMVSVVYGLRAAAGPQSTPAALPSGSSVAQTPAHLEGEADTLSPTISPQAAATLASDFLDRTDATTVQLSSYNGVQAYLVTFASGDVVYLSLSGNVLGSVAAPVQLASSNGHRRERESHGGGGAGEGGEAAHEQEHESEGGN